MSDTRDGLQDTPPCVDEVVEQYAAPHGTRADLVRRTGHVDDVDFVKVYGTRADTFGDSDGEDTTSERQVKLAEIAESNSYEVLVALAEYHGYRLEGT